MNSCASFITLCLLDEPANISLVLIRMEVCQPPLQKENEMRLSLVGFNQRTLDHLGEGEKWA